MSCDCPECRALADDIRANAEALAALRDEPLPPLVVRRKQTHWRLAAAAALLMAVSLPVMRQKPTPPATRQPSPEPLKIKMLTPDPDVVIYWLIDSKENK